MHVYLALVLGCCLLEFIDERLEIRLCLVDEQQQVKLQVSAEDLLSGLLGELYDQRQTILRQERTERLVGDGVVLQISSALVKLCAHQLLI